MNIIQSVTRIRLAMLGVVLTLTSSGMAQLTSFGVIDYPGAAGTVAYGINDAGNIVGAFWMSDQTRRGFLLRDGRYTVIDYPGASGTSVFRIDARGDVAGTYTDSSKRQHGFVLSNGVFRAVDFPGADQTMLYGFNSRGDATGMYFANGSTSKHYGWALVGGRFFSIDHPLPNDMSCGSWIGDGGEVAGHVQEKNGAYHGYIWKDGQFVTLFEFEGGPKWTFWDGPAEINAAGDVAGTYTDARGKQRGFFLRKSGITTFDVPESLSTRVMSMNRSGQIAGLFVDSGGVNHGFVTSVSGASRGQVLMVDDDGVECPGALKTIQEAVAQASPGATILVCPGIYSKTVTIAGPEKSGLKLISLGLQDEVVLQGDYTERDGFHLENVDNVLVRGFTVRDFGKQPTTESAWGDGNNIYLLNAQYNRIENNRLFNGDMVGIRLVDSGHNLVQFNTMLVDNPNLANCGVHLNGSKAVDNLFRQNFANGNKMAGLMLSGAGPGNVLMDNDLSNNGRQGILNNGTPGTRIEGNRISYNRGPWGTSPYAKDLLGLGFGILLQNSDGVTITDNRLRSNSGGDLNWDGKGANRIEANACDTSTPSDACKY